MQASISFMQSSQNAWGVSAQFSVPSHISQVAGFWGLTGVSMTPI